MTKTIRTMLRMRRFVTLEIKIVKRVQWATKLWSEGHWFNAPSRYGFSCICLKNGASSQKKLFNKTVVDSNIHTVEYDNVCIKIEHSKKKKNKWQHCFWKCMLTRLELVFNHMIIPHTWLVYTKPSDFQLTMALARFLIRASRRFFILSPCFFLASLFKLSIF